MEIKLTEKERKFILKSIWNIGNLHEKTQKDFKDLWKKLKGEEY